MCNQEVRQSIKDAGIYQYQVADALGVTEMTLIRWLRKPLSPDKAQKVSTAIQHAVREVATYGKS